MFPLLCFILAILASPFKSRIRLEAENAALRHQLIVLRRKMHGRAPLTNNDRWFFIQMYRWFPSILQVLTIIRPETLIQLAWLWLRHQPQSALALWFEERVRRNGDRLKKTTIVALARKLLVALWKYVTAGVVIEGAVMKAA